MWRSGWKDLRIWSLFYYLLPHRNVYFQSESVDYKDFTQLLTLLQHSACTGFDSFRDCFTCCHSSNFLKSGSTQYIWLRSLTGSPVIYLFCVSMWMLFTVGLACESQSLPLNLGIPHPQTWSEETVWAKEIHLLLTHFLSFSKVCLIYSNTSETLLIFNFYVLKEISLSLQLQWSTGGSYGAGPLEAVAYLPVGWLVPWIWTTIHPDH